MPEKGINNQKVVFAVKESVNGKKKPYMRVNQDSMSIAMTNLKPNTFKVWCYIVKNQDNWNFQLSSKHGSQFTGMCVKTFESCVNELIEKGYLELVNKEQNRWAFYELPEAYKEQAEAVDTAVDEFQF